MEFLCTLNGSCSPIEEHKAGAHDPAAITKSLAVNVPLLVTTVTSAPGMIWTTWQLSCRVPPRLWNCC